LGGVSIARFAGGRIEEEWAIWNTLGIMKQLGIIPQQPPALDAGAAKDFVEV